MPEKVVDYSAVGRISRRVELKSIRLYEISAKCEDKTAGPLEAKLESDCSVLPTQKELLEVVCDYKFSAAAAEKVVATARIKYIVSYELRGEEPLDENDLSQFALANGTAHSWPFLRECIYELTAKMGYSPYTLPVVHFRPKPPKQEKPAKLPPKVPTG